MCQITIDTDYPHLESKRHHKRPYFDRNVLICRLYRLLQPIATSLIESHKIAENSGIRAISWKTACFFHEMNSCCPPTKSPRVVRGSVEATIFDSLFFKYSPSIACSFRNCQVSLFFLNGGWSGPQLSFRRGLLERRFGARLGRSWVFLRLALVFSFADPARTIRRSPVNSLF